MQRPFYIACGLKEHRKGGLTNRTRGIPETVDGSTTVLKKIRGSKPIRLQGKPAIRKQVSECSIKLCWGIPAVRKRNPRRAVPGPQSHSPEIVQEMTLPKGLITKLTLAVLHQV